MESLEKAYELARTGRVSEALRALEGAKIPQHARATADVLRAELLEGTGQHDLARSLAQMLLKSGRLPKSEHGRCESVLAKVLIDDGDIDGGIAHFQRSASRAEEVSSVEGVFLARLELFNVLSERLGPDAAAALLADVRRLATILGDPRCTAKLHLFVGEMEAKRGLLENARRHVAIAVRILKSSPQTYFEAFAENTNLAICVLRSQFDAARAYGVRATELAAQSGVASISRASIGNFGNLFYSLGDFDHATECFEKALAVLPNSGAKTSAGLDSLARVRLMQGRLAECSELLDRVEASIRTEQDRSLYGHRYAELTRAHLLAKQGRFEDAIVKSDSTLALAVQVDDMLLMKKACLTKADLLQRTGSSFEAIQTIQPIMSCLGRESPDLYAQVELILACALVVEDDPISGRFHRDRAARIYESLRSATAQVELEHRWTEALSMRNRSIEGSAPGKDVTIADAQATGRRTLHSVAAALTHTSRPELVARELVDVLTATNCVYTARATSSTENEKDDTIHAPVLLDLASGSVAEQRLAVGLEHDRTIQVVVRPKTDIESVATLNAVTLLVAALQELERARAEREERATLWPVEELPIDGSRSVISGHMRELMNYARRIAKTNVNVLITGESGTGKEIVARAIHDFSDRAQKPFVPFNCTAIPRDLLESQLFGHRRGAFTGADRDHAGLIRAAREGTLFLDEIGELGLDLQPKLLRFLESGEIAPLGEPGPLTIDVRIVAATNNNLEDAVRAGKFREDLFYRLNVVRLSLRPLRERRDEIPGFVNHFVARAAEEFNKGHLRVAEETMERLLLYRWPGNVRQLHNELRRMGALAEPNSTLLPHAISDDILGALPIFRHPPANGKEIAVQLHDKLLPTLARIECEMIKAALCEHHGKLNAVATALGISRKGLYLKRQRFGL